MYYVYLIRSQQNNSYYVGYTKDIRSRLKSHNAGNVRSTKPSRPYALVYYEAYLYKEVAIKREKELKHRRIAKEEIIKRLDGPVV